MHPYDRCGEDCVFQKRVQPVYSYTPKLIGEGIVHNLRAHLLRKSVNCTLVTLQHDSHLLPTYSSLPCVVSGVECSHNDHY